MMSADNLEEHANLPDELGGEYLEGSGFEHENPEPDSEWRDPR